MKIIIRILKFCLLFILAVFAVNSLLKVDDLQKKCPSLSSCSGKFDAIIAISGGKTSARTAHAVKLYQSKLARNLIFSGAAADPSSPSNAQQMKDQAVAASVPPHDIITENAARNTSQNAKFSSEIIKKYKFKRIILITSGYHQWRASLEFSKYLKNSGVEIVNSSAENDPDWGGFWWLNPKSWVLALKELAGVFRFFIGASE